MTCLHPKDLDDRHGAWQMIARTGKIAAGQLHDSITETSFDGGALVVVFQAQSRHPSLSFTDFIPAILHGQGWLRTAGILDVRLGRDSDPRTS
jgi:hypothetical protein